MSKQVTLQQAVDMIHDGDTIAVSGFERCTVAEEVYKAIGQRFDETGHPCGMTLMHAAGNQGIRTGFTREKEGMWDRYITAHFAGNQVMIDRVVQNKMKAYILPQGVIDHMYRGVAGGKIGAITKVGLETFCDPRLGGGKMNEITTEDIVELTKICGEEYLVYKTPKLDIGVVRGSYADENGNISIEEESAPVDCLDVVMGVKAMGGKVIVQVKGIISNESMVRKNVWIPGTLVDAVVVCEDPITNHMQTSFQYYNPAISGQSRIPMGDVAKAPLDERKVIARRAAIEFKPNTVVNLGLGIPEMVGLVAAEEGISDKLVLTVESGLIGGVPLGKGDFGSAYNAWAALPMVSQFDVYDAGGLATTSLGFAEVNPQGDVNVSRFGVKIAGAGGFIDISQNTPVVCFSGTFTTGGCKFEVKDGKVNILQEGKRNKFLNKIDQVTFSAHYATTHNQKVLFITERCVFLLTEKGLELIEIAPGIDLQKDILDHMEFAPIVSPDLKLMDERIFKDEPMGLAEMMGA